MGLCSTPQCAITTEEHSPIGAWAAVFIDGVCIFFNLTHLAAKAETFTRIPRERPERRKLKELSKAGYGYVLSIEI